MDQNTPLAEVAHHLSATTAAFLGEQAESVQIAVLTMLRLTISRLEESGVQLDPMTYQMVLSQMVAAHAGSFNSIAPYVHLFERLQAISNSTLPGPQKLYQLQEALNGR